MKTRVISGIAIALLTILIVGAGSYVLTAGLCIISVIAYLELTYATKVRLEDKKVTGMEIIGVAGVFIYYTLICLADLFSEEELHFYMLLVLVLVLITLMMIYVFTFPKYKAYQVMNSYFSFVYAPVMLSFILLTRNISNANNTDNYKFGFFAAWLIFIIAWASDTCAYFVGVLFGKHKIFPKLSPKKTVEGCLGGVVGSGLAGYAYGLILAANGVIQNYQGWFVILLCIVGSVVGQFGDLAASAIKRNFEIKDYGNIIPGHGGIMDRFDSIILTAPFIYMLSMFVFK